MTDKHQLGDEPGDLHLDLIHRISSGASREELLERYTIGIRTLNARVREAASLLKYHAELTREQRDAVLHPRIHGTAPKRGHTARYSGPAVTIERIRDLTAFDEVVADVVEAQHDLEGSLDFLKLWLSGWRPGWARTVSDTIERARIQRTDDIIYLWPEGFRSAAWLDCVNTLELKMSAFEDGLLWGKLLTTIKDPSSSLSARAGARIAIPLPEAAANHWVEFRQGNPGRNPKVRITHTPGDPALCFKVL